MYLCKAMKLSTLKKLLSQIPEIRFELSDGTIIPTHVHITEVGELQKNFIDCGGEVRMECLVTMQLWYAEDTHHRLEPNKLLQIIELSENKLSIGDHEVEVEYQQSTVGRYRLSFNGSVFQLLSTQTDCLAKDQCIIPSTKPKVRLTASGVKCDPQSGCC